MTRGICVLALAQAILFAACSDDDACHGYTCYNGGTCVVSKSECSKKSDYFRERFLSCYRDKHFCTRNYGTCSDFCAEWMGCSGFLTVGSDGVDTVLGVDPGTASCRCAAGFSGPFCRTMETDASLTSDPGSPADAALGDDAEPPDAALGDEPEPIDVVVGDVAGPIDAVAGDTTGPTDTASPDVPALPAWPEACTAWNAAIAARTVFCLKASPDYLAGLPGALDCTTLGADIDAGLTTYDATRADGCTADLKALPCSGLVSTTSPGPFEFPVLGTACEGVLVGTGASANGQTPATECRRSTQCASGYCTTATLPGQCPGICEDRVAEGVECAYWQQCAPGLACASGTCRARGTVGTSCYMDERCAADLRCLDGTCQPPRATGEPCGYDLQCVAGDRCFNGTCQPLVGLDGACVEAVAPSLPTVCGAGYVCTSGTCAAYPVVGASCAASLACTGGYCDFAGSEPTCAAYLPVGAPCTSKYQCASQLASFDACVASGDFFCAPP